MGYGHEVDLVKAANELDLLTTPYVFDADQARDMTKAGADIVVCHMGLTTGGSNGADTALKLSDCVPKINEWTEAAKKVRKDVMEICHGGPIAQPEDATYILGTLPGLPRFLWGVEHGTSANGNSDCRADTSIQAHRAPAACRARRCALNGLKLRGLIATFRGKRK